MKVLLIVYICLQIFFVIRNFWKASRVTNDTLVAFTGTMGSGKTYMAVNTALAKYNELVRAYRRCCRNPLYRKLYPEKALQPYLYSNIPIYIGKKRGKRQYCRVLTSEHLKLKRRIPPNSVVVIDEFGLVGSQYDWNNPYIVEQSTTLFRFCRHWDIQKIILTDQSLGIVKPVRERIGIAYMLTDFHRYSWLPFYKVTKLDMLMVADTASTLNNDMSQYFFGVLPYRWFQKIFGTSRYASKCYKPIYTEGWDPSVTVFNDLYTRYVIDMTVNGFDMKRYQDNKRSYREHFMTELENIPSD